MTFSHRSGDLFEELVCQVLHSMGYPDAQVVGAAAQHTQGDRGIDLRANDGRLIVQCKCYQPGKNISVDSIRAFYGALHDHHADLGWFVTTSDYTTQAREFARDKPLELLTYDTLCQKQAAFQQQRAVKTANQERLHAAEITALRERQMFLEQQISDPNYVPGLLERIGRLENTLGHAREKLHTTQQDFQTVLILLVLLLISGCCIGLYSYTEIDHQATRKAAAIATTSAKALHPTTIPTAPPRPTPTPTPFAVLEIRYLPDVPQDIDWGKYDLRPGKLDSVTLQAVIDITHAYTVGKRLMDNEPRLEQVQVYLR